jgi:hypothetical protein
LCFVGYEINGGKRGRRVKAVIKFKV